MDGHSRHFRRARAAALGIAVVLGALAAPAAGAWAADAAPLTTKMHCTRPDIPARLLPASLQATALIFERALRTGACTYSPEPVEVMPLRFVDRVAADPDAAEPYGYVWEVRLADGAARYWFFWQAEHEWLLQRAPGI